MSYCTNSDVAVLLQFTGGFDTNSQPTALQVNSIITMIESALTQSLSIIGVTIPVTDPDFLNKLKLISIKGSAGYVSSSYYKNGNFTETNGQAFYQEYQDFIQEIEDNPAKFLSMANPTAQNNLINSSNNVSTGYLKESDLGFLTDVKFP